MSELADALRQEKELAKLCPLGIIRKQLTPQDNDAVKEALDSQMATRRLATVITENSVHECSPDAVRRCRSRRESGQCCIETGPGRFYEPLDARAPLTSSVSPAPASN